MEAWCTLDTYSKLVNCTSRAISYLHVLCPDKVDMSYHVYLCTSPDDFSLFSSGSEDGSETRECASFSVLDNWVSFQLSSAPTTNKKLRFENEALTAEVRLLALSRRTSHMCFEDQEK